MKNRFAVFTIVSAILSIVPFLRSKNRNVITLLWLPKLVAGAFALWLALTGVISTVYGWVRRNWRLVLTGGTGALFSLLYIRQVTRKHAGFDQAFGKDWQQKIPYRRRKHLQRVRWPVFVLPARRIPYQRDVNFGVSPATGKPLLADLWMPRKRTDASGVGLVYIHGGSWRVGTKGMGTRTFFQRLASLGHVIMDIDYTLWPNSNMINMQREVKLAVAWLKENSRALGINPERIVLMGGSAGAHLALLSAYTPDHPDLKPDSVDGDLSVRGVVAFYPPVDFRNLPEDLNSLLDWNAPEGWSKLFQETVIHFMNDSLRVASSLRGSRGQVRRSKEEASLFIDPADYISQIIGGPLEKIHEEYALLSPAAHIRPGLPPTLLLQGTDDFFQLLPGVQRLHRSLLAAGVTSILVEFPHCEHAFDLILPQTSPAAQAATYDVERFLAMMA